MRGSAVHLQEARAAAHPTKAPRLKRRLKPNLVPRRRQRLNLKMIKAALSFVLIYFKEFASSKMSLRSAPIHTMRGIAKVAERKRALVPQRYQIQRVDIPTGMIGTIPERTSLMMPCGK